MNSYLADLNSVKVTPDMLNIPAGIHWKEFVGVGYIVRTNYNTGPYVITEVHEHSKYEVFPILSFVCLRVGQKGKSYSYLNEYVAVNGQLLHLFKDNDAMVIVAANDQLENAGVPCQLNLF